jgi:putative phosphoribosyl transferase
MDRPFADRREAGRLLAAELQRDPSIRGDSTVVLALPRGGVPVAYEVARALKAPLAVFVVRKLGVPWHPELAMGAIASGGVRIVNDEVVRHLGIPPAAIDRVAEEESRELARREALYNGSRPVPPLTGRTVVLVDDGLATGSTMRAAVEAVRKQHPKRVIVAVPVGAPDTCAQLERKADAVVCLRTPMAFNAVGSWYQVFDQTSDEEVRELLDAAASRATAVH